MAITHFLFRMLRDLRGQNAVGPVRSICDIGQQNWYQSVHPEAMGALIDGYAPEQKREALRSELQKSFRGDPQEMTVEPTAWAQLFYSALFDHEEYLALKLGSLSGSKVPHSPLLHPIHDGQHDLVMNLGGLEHVFPVSGFSSCHQLTKPGGYMVHFLPCQGQAHRELLSLHPTFFFDLAAANQYRIVCGAMLCDGSTSEQVFDLPTRSQYAAFLKSEHRPKSAFLFFCLQKFFEDRNFVFPARRPDQAIERDDFMAEAERNYSPNTG